MNADDLEDKLAAHVRRSLKQQAALIARLVQVDPVRGLAIMDRWSTHTRELMFALDSGPPRRAAGRGFAFGPDIPMPEPVAVNSSVREMVAMFGELGGAQRGTMGAQRVASLTRAWVAAREDGSDPATVERLRVLLDAAINTEAEALPSPLDAKPPRVEIP